LTDLRSRVLDTPGHVNKRNNAILRVADVVDLIAEVIEVLGEGRFEPSHAVMSAVGGALQPSISRVPDDVGREEGEGSIDSFRAKGLEGVSYDPHVLLRHRLLREAQGSEGLGVIPDDLHADDLALANGKDVRGPNVRPRATAFGPPDVPRRNAVANIDEVADQFQGVGVPGVAELFA